MTVAATSELHEIRKRAAESFEAHGYPTKRNEEWKYTSVAAIVKAQFPTAAPTLDQHTLRAALEEHPGLIEEHLGRYASADDNAFVALNTAHFEDGAFLHVPKNTVVEKPVWIDYTAVPGRTTHPRNLIIVDANSQVRIIERYRGNGRYFTNAVTEIVAGENSVVEHVKLEQESAESFHIATIQVQQSANSNFKSHNISFGGLLVRNDVNAVLATGSEGTLNGLYLTSGKQHIDNHTVLDHAAPHAASHELYKGILDGMSTGVFNGRVIVRQDAQKTDAKQTNKNLVLSPGATIYTKPELQIFADDVRCTHGATVGQLDADALFYLRARGIGEIEARDLLIYAFARDVIDRIGVPEIHEYLEKALFERLVFSRQTEGSAS
jgi:Fe-S cluster assembly protein SufD